MNDGVKDGVEGSSGSALRWVRGAGGAVAAFALLLVVSVPLALERGRGRWFFADDWTFLQERQIDSFGDLLRDHNDHWVAVPLVAYRFLYAAFGIRSYLPYQLLAIATHLVVAILVRAIMRRSGAGPWMATAVASVLVAFGPGGYNIVFGFQITFTMGLAFALGQFLVADGDDPSTLRQAAGVALGLLAVASAGVAVPVVAGTAVALAVRWGWRRAAVQAGPVAAVYLLWFVVHPRSDAEESRAKIGEIGGWVREALSGTIDSLGEHPAVAVAFGIALAAGTVVALVDAPAGTSSRRSARLVHRLVPGAPAWGLAGSAAVFVLLTAWGRGGLGAATGRGGRYLYVIVALVLPWLAVAFTALVRRQRVLGPVLVILLAVPVIGNLRAERWLVDAFPVQVYERQEYVVTSILRVPGAATAPTGLQPLPPIFDDLSPTMGFLRQAERSGKLVVSDEALTPAQQFELQHLLVLEQLDVQDRPDGCEQTDAVPPSMHRAGDRYWFRGALAASSVDPALPGVLAITSFYSASGNVVEVVRDAPQLAFSLQGEGELWSCPA